MFTHRTVPSPRAFLGLLLCVALLLLTSLTRRASDRSDVASFPLAPARPASDVQAAPPSFGPTSASSAVATAPAAAARPAVSPPDTLDQLFASALANSDPGRRRDLIRAIADHLAVNDPLRATDYLQTILGLNDHAAGGDAYTFTKVFADKLAERDPEAVIAWTRHVPSPLRDVAYQMTARRWSESDPWAVATWCATIEDPSLRATVIRATAQQLLAADPTNFGATWAADLARTADGPRFAEIVTRQWAKADPAAAQAWLMQLPDPGERAKALDALGTTLAEKDPDAAIAWASQLPAGELRNGYVQNTITVWALQDPAAAAAWVTQNANLPGLVDNSVGAILAAWMGKDPAAAARWLESVPVKPETKDYFLTLAGARRPSS